MKLVTIARVKNELDIIEAFVRHHAQHFDKLIVLDDGSSDGTYQILLQLQSVYPDLVVLHQPTVGYMQDRHMTLLLRMAVDKFGADWVAPLDADEFIEPANGLMLSQALAGRQPAVYSLGWNNFVWSADLAQSDERNPVLRQRFCLPTRSDQTKVLLHAQFVSATTKLSLGNHLVVDDGRPLRTQPLDCVRLCHYPVRSVAQYAGKITIGYLQYLATPDWDPANGFQYIKPFQELAEFGLQGISKRMKQDSLDYSINESGTARANTQTMEAPLNYLGGPLTLRQGEGLFISNALRYAEMVATEFAANVKKREDFDRVSTQNAFLQPRLSELELELLNSQKKAAEQAAQQTQRCLELEVELLNTQEQTAEKAQRLSELELELLNFQKKAAEQAAQQTQRCLELEVELLNTQEQTAEKAQRLSELELELLNFQKKAAEQAAQQTQRCLELEVELLNTQEQTAEKAQRLSELELELLNFQKKAAEQTAQQTQRCLELGVDLLNSQEQTAEKAQRISELELELLNSQEQVAREARQLSILELEVIKLQNEVARQARQLQSRTFRFLTRVHSALIRAKILRLRG